MKTITEIEAERATLQDALKQAQQQAGERGMHSNRVQHLTTAHALGNATLVDLQTAQRNLEASVDAAVRVQHLSTAVADVDHMLVEARHQERSRFVQGIKDEFQTTFDEYRQQSAKTLEIFRELQRLDTQYRGIGSGPTAHLQHLLDPFHAELNLPVLTGALSSRSNFTTGQEA